MRLLPVNTSSGTSKLRRMRVMRDGCPKHRGHDPVQRDGDIHVFGPAGHSRRLSRLLTSSGTYSVGAPACDPDQSANIPLTIIWRGSRASADPVRAPKRPPACSIFWRPSGSRRRQWTETTPRFPTSWQMADLESRAVPRLRSVIRRSRCSLTVTAMWYGGCQRTCRFPRRRSQSGAEVHGCLHRLIRMAADDFVHAATSLAAASQCGLGARTIGVSGQRPYDDRRQLLAGTTF